MRLYLIICLIFVSFLLSCNNTAPQKPENKLYIKIEDENGKALEEVDIHFFYIPQNEDISSNNNSNSSCNYPNPFNSTTNIGINLSVNSHVSLCILDRFDSTKVIKTICNKNLNAGSHKFTWNGTNDSGRYVTNNIYNCQLITNELRCTKKIFFEKTDPEQIESLNCIPLATSDTKGNIEIEYSIFPTNLETDWTDKFGNHLGVLRIPNSISLVFIKEGYLPITKDITIVEYEPTELIIVLNKE